MRNIQLPKHGYYWVPAAVDYGIFQYVTVLHNEGAPSVRYKSNDGTHLFRFHDRRVAISYRKSNVHGDTKDVSLAEVKDEVFPDLPLVLVNAHDGADLSLESGVHKKRKELAQRYAIIQDSGGFQIISKQLPFIDPSEVVSLHNKYADLGVCLDVPAGPFSYNPRNHAKLATILALNNQVMLKNKRKGLRLVNVGHGTTISHRRHWMEISASDEINFLCVGGLRTFLGPRGMTEVPPEAFVGHLIFSILFSPKRAYHVLGVSAPWQMALMARVAEKFKVLIVSDSASAKLMSKSGLFYQTTGALESIGKPVANHELMPCACPTCSLLKYRYIGQRCPPVLTHHNIWVTMNQATVFRKAARLPVEEALNLYESEILRLKERIRLGFQRAMRLIEAIDSPAHFKKHDYPFRDKRNASLFMAPDVKKRERHFQNIVKAYSEYHGVKI